MKTISLHVSERDYQELKSMAAAADRPVAELLRQAMSEYLQNRRKASHSVADLAPHPSGRLLRPWTRSEILDEMLER